MGSLIILIIAGIVGSALAGGMGAVILVAACIVGLSISESK